MHRCCGSTLYHLRKEALYFNLDNTFATSLLFLTFYAGALAFHVKDHLQISLTLGGLPVAVFLIVYCGMPAIATRCHVSGAHIRQCAGNRYDLYHTLWHFASGLGTAKTAHFFHVHWPTLQCGGPAFAAFPHMPVVPTLSLLLGLAVNIMGNHAGIMPVE